MKVNMALICSDVWLCTGTAVKHILAMKKRATQKQQHQYAIFGMFSSLYLADIGESRLIKATQH